MTPAMLRSMVRPVVTILLTLAIIGFVAGSITIPDQLWNAFLLVIGMWFGSRTVASK